jgi:hypothetical protein
VNLDLVLARLACLEAERSVRWVMTRYMALCDVPRAAVGEETLGQLFASDAIWEGIGPLYASKFGRMQGRDQILTMLTRYLPPTPHFRINTHFLTSEQIDVAEDARSATGRWVMLQASSYEAGNAELISARLQVDFAPSPAQAHDTRQSNSTANWCISHFRTERLFDAPWQVSPPRS